MIPYSFDEYFQQVKTGAGVLLFYIIHTYFVRNMTTGIGI